MHFEPGTLVNTSILLDKHSTGIYKIISISKDVKLAILPIYIGGLLFGLYQEKSRLSARLFTSPCISQ